MVTRRNPEGPSSSISNRSEHPVVHITWNDAYTYCFWKNKRLPTQAGIFGFYFKFKKKLLFLKNIFFLLIEEWEFAAQTNYTENSNNVHNINFWQGKFPFENSKVDGFDGTAPVKAFPPNSFGLYQMIGNVWEWTSDDFDYSSFGIVDEGKKILKGGSFIDSLDGSFNYVARPSTVLGNTPESSSQNVGFRCASSHAPNGEYRKDVYFSFKNEL